MEKNMVEKIREEAFAIYDEYLEFQEFDNADNPNTKNEDGNGGRIICKKDNKKFEWGEWGRSMNRAFTKMHWHLFHNHNQSHAKMINRFLDEWCDKKQIV